MDAEAQVMEGGFSAPVFDAQAVFRAVMNAMARPGTIEKLDLFSRPPAPLSPTLGAIALALCDHDTPVWLDAGLHNARAVESWLGFHTGAPIARTPAEAHFVLCTRPEDLVPLDGFAQGTQEYPDRSATLVLQVDTLCGGHGLLLEGPGIETTTHLAPSPLPRRFAGQWNDNNQRFPRGVDVIFAGPEGVACLPRTTRIRPMEG
jgi:alpha-D-ribose 1-methylphosphonate 5-triphosphate synthase subunit PhnH